MQDKELEKDLVLVFDTAADLHEATGIGFYGLSPTVQRQYLEKYKEDHVPRARPAGVPSCEGGFLMSLEKLYKNGWILYCPECQGYLRQSDPQDFSGRKQVVIDDEPCDKC